jgi:hypothetical protein
LQTLRIPLGAFEGATLDAVRAVRFTFTTPFEAGILLSNIRATRATTVDATELAASGAAAFRGFIATPPTLQLQPQAPGISGAVMEAALEPDLVVTGNSIVGVVRRGTSHVEVALESTHPFELRPKNLVLSIGSLTSREARHPTGDLHTVQFVFAREAFDRLGALEPVRVDYGSGSPIVWDFGLLATALSDD